MATFYWVGGTGNWTDAAHWATSSGGAGGAGVPDGTVDCVFDSVSGWQMQCTLPQSTDTYWANCKSLDTTAYGFAFNNQLTFGNIAKTDQRMNIWGTSAGPSSPVMKIGLPVQFSVNTWLSFAAAGTAYVTSGGVALPNIQIIYNCNVVLNSATPIQYNGQWLVYNGTLNSNGKNITGDETTTIWARPNITYGDIAYLNLSGSIVETGSLLLGGLGGSITFTAPTDLRIHASISTDLLTPPAFNTVTVLGDTNTPSYYPLIDGDVFVYNLDISAASKVYFTPARTTQVTTLTPRTSGTPTQLRRNSNYSSGQWTLQKDNSIPVPVDYVDVKDSVGLPFTAPSTYTWIAGSHSIDSSGNTGWQFPLPTCTFNVSPVGSVLSAAAGTYTAASVSAANSPCSEGSWTASNSGSPSWITKVSPISGSGSALTYVTVTLQANSSTSSRTGSITVNGQSVSVTQAGATPPTCTFTPTGNIAIASDIGSEDVLTIAAAPSGCVGGTWSITGLSSYSSWLSASILSGGPSNLTVTFTALTTNTSSAERVANLALNGTAFTITQAGASSITCTGFTASPAGPRNYLVPDSVTDLFTILGSPSGCTNGSFTIAWNDTWMAAMEYTLLSDSSVHSFTGAQPYTVPGAATVLFTATQNTGATARSEIISIVSGNGTQQIAVSQVGTSAPPSCTSFSSLQAGPYNITGDQSTALTQQTITVTGNPTGCTGGAWTVTSSASWLTYTTPVSGAFNVVWQANNTGASRSGTITIHGNPNQDIVFTQAALSPITTYCTTLSCPNASPYTVSSDSSTGATQLKLLFVGDATDCVPQNFAIVASTGWLHGIAPVDNKHVVIDWDANTTGVVRTGTVTISFNPPGVPTPTNLIWTIIQNPVIVVPQPPNLPTNVVATLNPDHTATITWNDGGQIGLTDVQFQTVTSGVVGAISSIGVVSNYSTEVLLPNITYNFRITLVNSAGASTTVTSNSVTYTLIQPPEVVLPPTVVAATFDDPTQTITIEWDLNGQTNLSGYSILGRNGSSTIPVGIAPIATSYVITDLTPFASGSIHFFQIALVRVIGGTTYTSAYTASNTVYIVKPTVPRHIYPVSFFNAYPIIDNTPVPISHLVYKHTNNSKAVNPDVYYAIDGSSTRLSVVDYTPVSKRFTDHVFTITNSYGDTVSAATTWNYENRVGVIYFELPTDTNIDKDGISLYFKVAPEVYRTIYNSNRVTLNYYTLPVDHIGIDDVGNLSLNKDAYVITSTSDKVCAPSSLSELKQAGSNYIVKALSTQSLIRLYNGRRLVAIRFALSLAEDVVLPTGFNYVPILVKSLQLSVNETTIPHPSNFRLLPTVDDIVLRWDAPVFTPVFGYKVEVQKELNNLGEFGIYVTGTNGSVPLPNAWATLIVSNMDVSLKSESSLLVPLQTWDNTKRYRARVSTLVGSQDYEFSLPSYSLKGTIGTFTAPDPPVNARIFEGNNQFYVSWDSPTTHVGCPIFKFEVTAYNVDTSATVTPTPIIVYRDDSVTAYETHGVLIDNTNAIVVNGSRYHAHIVAYNAVGHSLAAETGSITVAPSLRLQTINNDRYKKFYPYPIELQDATTYGQPLYPESVVDFGNAYITSRAIYPVMLNSTNNVLHLFVSEYAGIQTAALRIANGKYLNATQLAEAIKQAIVSSWNTTYGPLPIYVSNITPISFTLMHPPQGEVAQLYPITGINSANLIIFGGDSIVVSPNETIHVDKHIPSVEYDLAHKKALVDMKPYVPVVERFDITPATRSVLTSTDYPLSFNLQYKDIRAGSVSIEWYVSGVQEIITDTGNGFIISAEKIDACGNRIPSQQLGFVDYASGIISCSLPEITSGYAVVRYAANLPVMNQQEYIWSPTPHFGLNLHLKEPAYFGVAQWTYLVQNADKLRPGYTVLEYMDITIDLKSSLANISDSIFTESQNPGGPGFLGPPLSMP